MMRHDCNNRRGFRRLHAGPGRGVVDCMQDRVGVALIDDTVVVWLTIVLGQVIAKQMSVTDLLLT